MRFLTLILKNLARRKVRSALTVVGVAVAVGTLVALLGIAHGFEHTAVESFTSRGIDIVVIEAGKPDQLQSELDESLGDHIRALPGVKAVGAGLLELVAFRKGDSDINVLIQGWEPDGVLFDHLEVVSGRKFQPGDGPSALLGVTAAQNLGKQVGDALDLQGEEFKVVGVYKSHDLVNDGAVTVLLPELQRLMVRYKRVTGFSVILDPHRDPGITAESVCARIRELPDERGRRGRIAALPTLDYVKGSAHIRIAHAMSWLTSAIALVIGAVGMLNTMIMAVFERTKEIGILRAIGWRRSRIVRMILGEALLLSLTGAALGTLGAVGLTRWLSTFPQVSGFVAGRIYPAVVGQGFLMALLVGLLGGFYPAVRAARLLPTEALRHD